MTRKVKDSGSWGDTPIRERVDDRAGIVGAAILELRPQPPAECAEDELERFTPDLKFAEWIRDTFISAAGPIANEDHDHLLDAKIGALWTNCINVSKMRHVLATAEIPQTMGGAWKRGRADQQLRDWFEQDVDFLLTFYAPGMADLDDRSFCSVVEHELYHCAQKEDRYGAPAFDRETGLPIFGIRGHDVEEFSGVVRRYGAVGPVRELVEAAKRAPVVSDHAIAGACGTCDRRLG